jgi:manganese/zinc/iron transport system substrate-binding protein
LLVALLIGLIFAGANRQQAVGSAQDGRIRVVATIGQIADAAKNVGGDLVEVEALMGAGIDPHLYKASEGDIFELLDADLILYNGLHLEGRMGEVLDEFAAEKVVVAVAESVPHDQLLFPEEFAGQYDPHIWFDPTMWAYAVGEVRDALIEVDPANEETYTANADAYLAELAALDTESLAKMATIPEENRVLVTAHDAFNYFGRHFGLDVVGLQGMSTETEAGVGDLQQVTNLIVELGVPAIFVESSVSPRTIEAVQAAARDRGHEVAIGGELFSDAMGAEGTEEGTYIGMVAHNVNTITEALGGTIDE